VEQLAFPAVVAQERCGDLLKRRGKDCLQQLMRDPTDRLFAFPTIEVLGAAVPVRDHVVHVADENRIVREIEELGLLAVCPGEPLDPPHQPRHHE
jgi:hypothetical protein